MSSLHFYQLVKLSDAGWINRSKTPWIVNRRSVSRGDRRDYNSASPWCSWIGRWLTGRFLIKADPDIRIMGHRIGPCLFERVLDCVSGTGDISSRFDRCQCWNNRDQKNANDRNDDQKFNQRKSETLTLLRQRKSACVRLDYSESFREQAGATTAQIGTLTFLQGKGVSPPRLWPRKGISPTRLWERKSARVADAKRAIRHCEFVLWRTSYR